MSDDDEIQFGEVQFETPDQRKRPDQDRHWVTVPYGRPHPDDLPIFIDMDVLREMEAHSQDNRNVELGGVMLGGQYEDEDGNPFVIIRDSVRAKHYESSRGHFKFTHDTWSEITREHEQFSEHMKMIGWYHTHPGWGVFLSGMDIFICDHFFNRPLDVALVIDPIKLDRGFFYWDHDAQDKLPQCKGFHLFTTRHRARELHGYLYHLLGTHAPQPRQFTEAVAGAIDHPTYSDSWGDRSMYTSHQNTSWLSGAVVSLIMFQLLIVVFLAWDSGMLANLQLPQKDKAGKGKASASKEDAVVAEEVAQKIILIDQRNSDDRSQERETYQNLISDLDRQLAQGGETQGLVRAYMAQKQEIERLRSAAFGFEVNAKQKAELEKELALVTAQKEAFYTERNDWRKKYNTLDSDLITTKNSLKQSQKETATIQAKYDAVDHLDPTTFFGRWGTYFWFGLGLLVGAVCSGVAVTVVRNHDQGEMFESSSSSSENYASTTSQSQTQSPAQEQSQTSGQENSKPETHSESQNAPPATSSNPESVESQKKSESTSTPESDGEPHRIE